ncbi:uncharacterized protein [Amphiura filiformis]|uniref:uncharacterized protein n=1 Tax=Amphiura filiformis TaxID=82378 RepID=UPI003B21AAA2
MAQFLIKDFMPFSYDSAVSKRDFIEERTKEICDRKFEDDGFMVVDIGDVLKKHKEWLRELPQVTPFFAVKCMPYTPLLSVLAALGCGFDCASLEEIERVLSLGVSPSRIVYSHTRKQRSYIKYACKHNVDLMTFDDEAELLKIKDVFPKARLLLRLSIFDQTAQSPFGFKYGCHHKNVKHILQVAREHGLNVAGVHFHIGSGSQNPTVFESAIQFARKVFDVGNELGFHMNVLDIGGGFPGSQRSSYPFHQFAYSVREALNTSFPPESDVTIIAEPGRFYVESAATVVTNVIGVKVGRQKTISDRRFSSATLMKRKSKVPVFNRQSSTIQNRISRGESISHFAEMMGLPSHDKPLNYDYMYFVNDGLFTSFLRNLFGFPMTPPQPLRKVSEDEDEYLTMVMGETCPEEDIIADDCWLPKLKEGDWIYFEDMGAYTCMSTGFNGFNKQYFYYAVPENVWPSIEPLFAACTEKVDKIQDPNMNDNHHEDEVDGRKSLLLDVYSLKDIFYVNTMAQYIDRDFMPYQYERGLAKDEFIEKRTQEKGDRKFADDAFMVVDIGDVLKKHKEWLSELPRVTPFFAVKCMPYTPLLSVLASLGCGFDCASLEEIDRVLSLGVSPSRIVYSHTRKQRSYLSYAADNKVDLMTFDDETELVKIKETFPEARLLLRLSIYDQSAQHAFGFKYGCHHKNVKSMLEFVKKQGLQLVGVHFHIGSGSQNPEMFEHSLQFAKKVFDVGNRMGFNMNVLDIGGGFPGSQRCTNPFVLFASAVREGIENYFPPDSGVTIIAEPGRFYVESAATLVTNIIGYKIGRKARRSTGGSGVSKRISTISTCSNSSRRRSRPMLTRQPSSIQKRLSRHESISHFAEQTGLPSLDKPLNYDYMYFVNDGLFTSFLRNLFGFPMVPPRSLRDVDDDEMEYECMVMGETCPEEDVIIDECMLPRLEVGDWLFFEDMGAYTCMSTGFNGFNKQFFYYAVPENVWSYIQPLLARCREETEGSPVPHQTSSNGMNGEDQRENTVTEILEDVFSLEEV